MVDQQPYLFHGRPHSGLDPQQPLDQQQQQTLLMHSHPQSARSRPSEQKKHLPSMPGVASSGVGATNDATSTTANAAVATRNFIADEQDERRQRRLARNRESARQSRRRKKQYLETLEERVTQLSEEIDSSRLLHLEKSEDALRVLR